YQKKQSEIYLKAFEWRFEFPEVLNEDGSFEGFDIVIGNPPYISIQDLNPKLKEYYKKNHKHFYLRYDIFACFIEKALSLINSKGFLSFIIPSVFLKKYMLYNTNFSNIDLLKDGVFNKAVVPTMIFVLKKEHNENNKILVSKNKLKNNYLIKQDYLKDTENNVFNLELTERNYNFLKKIEKNTIKLGEISTVSNGINTGNLKKYMSKKYKNYYIKILKGRSIKKWKFNFENFYIKKDFSDYVSLGDVKVFQEEKLMMKRIGKKFEVCYDNSGIAALHTVHTIRLTNKKFDIKYILGLLNSKFMSYIFRLKVPLKGDIFPEFRVFDLNNQVVIKDISRKEQSKIIKFVDLIIKEKDENKNENTKNLENEIDKIIYKLYDLTKNEIKIIENKTI
ncbi:MAG: hypothetical protein B6I24_00320, partial [Bacteroidetes bacterium 4572_128]